MKLQGLGRTKFALRAFRPGESGCRPCWRTTGFSDVGRGPLREMPGRLGLVQNQVRWGRLMRKPQFVIASLMAMLVLGSGQSVAQSMHVEPSQPPLNEPVEASPPPPMPSAPELEALRPEPLPRASYSTSPALVAAPASRCPLNRMALSSSTDPTGGGCQEGGSSDVTTTVGSCERHSGDYVFPDTGQHARHGDGVYCRGPNGWYFSH